MKGLVGTFQKGSKGPAGTLFVNFTFLGWLKPGISRAGKIQRIHFDDLCIKWGL